MYPNLNKTKPFGRISNSINGRENNSNFEYNNRSLREKNNLSGVKMTESSDGYHFEFKMIGYIKEDFSYYLNNNNLVVTTEKRNAANTTNQLGGNNVAKHSYCYPSALFKKTFQLPINVEKDKILIDYNNHVLSIDLFKLKIKSSL